MNTNEVARIASLVGEPSRTAMLLELMDGRALTAHELASAAHVLAPTASRHLAQLVDGGLLKVEQHGRHRYHRLASPEVAALLESIMQMAAASGARSGAALVVGPKEAAMRRARSCYDHIAGRLGVAIAERLIEGDAIVFEGEVGRVSPGAKAALAPLGIDPDASAAGASARRTACRPCLDWSERRFHVAGRLAAMICIRCLDQRWLLRRAGSRALDVTAPGQRVLGAWLGSERWRWVASAGEPARRATPSRRA